MADFGGIWENLSGKFLSMYLVYTDTDTVSVRLPY